MSWESKTNQFGTGEMSTIEKTPAAQLAGMALASTPVVALRVMAEVMLNGDEEKLNALLENNVLTTWWRDYKTDRFVDEKDHEYAAALEKRLKKLSA